MLTSLDLKLFADPRATILKCPAKDTIHWKGWPEAVGRISLTV